MNTKYLCACFKRYHANLSLKQGYSFHNMISSMAGSREISNCFDTNETDNAMYSTLFHIIFM